MSEPDWQEMADRIVSWGRDLGFSATGITDTGLSCEEDHLASWLDKDYHGEMAYMEKHGSMRTQPKELHPGTLSIISLRLDYLVRTPDPGQLLASDTTAYISRYALGRDYHKVIRQKLKQLVALMADHLDSQGYEGFHSRVFTDSAPLLEKALAQKAGLGWIGKNTLLLNEKAGSWFFLGEVLTSLPLPQTGDIQVNRCGSCAACMDICPTDAIVAPYELDARRCISYLTIEYKGSIPEEFRAPMGNRVFGCDDCQLVCPWNRYAGDNKEQDFRPRHGLESAQLAELFQWDEETFLDRTAGSAIRRTGYQGWLRNLAVGLGNSAPDPELIRILEQRKGRSSLLDEHINWAIERLGTNPG